MKRQDHLWSVGLGLSHDTSHHLVTNSKGWMEQVFKSFILEGTSKSRGYGESVMHLEKAGPFWGGKSKHWNWQSAEQGHGLPGRVLVYTGCTSWLCFLKLMSVRYEAGENAAKPRAERK